MRRPKTGDGATRRGAIDTLLFVKERGVLMALCQEKGDTGAMAKRAFPERCLVGARLRVRRAAGSPHDHHIDMVDIRVEITRILIPFIIGCRRRALHNNIGAAPQQPLLPASSQICFAVRGALYTRRLSIRPV